MSRLERLVDNLLKHIQKMERRTYHEGRIAKQEQVDGEQIGVSTVYTDDEGYETALIDVNDVHPVERYKSKEEAEAGHKKWVEFAKDGDGKKVFKLTLTEFREGGYLEDEEITLKK